MPDQPQTAGFYRYRLGDYRVVSLNDGSLTRDRPPGFVRNADDADVGRAFAEAGMPEDKLTLTFNPLAIQTPSGTVLIDTGFGESGPPTTGRLLANLRAAGIEPADIATIIISHLHGDHILGLRRKDGSRAFPNARLFVPQPEIDYWLDDARLQAAPEAARANFETARRVMDGLDRETFAWGDEIMPGFTAVQADGHTPGMSAIEIASADDRLLYVADITNNPLLFVRHPRVAGHVRRRPGPHDPDPASPARPRRRRTAPPTFLPRPVPRHRLRRPAR